MTPLKTAFTWMFIACTAILIFSQPPQTPAHADSEHPHASQSMVYQAKEYIYVGGHTDTGAYIEQIAVEADESLVPLTPPTIKTPVRPDTLTHDAQGRYVYVGVGDSVWQFRVLSDGKLRRMTSVYYIEKGGVSDDLTSLNLRPDGKYLYGLIGNPYTQQGIHHGQIVVFRKTTSGELVEITSARIRNLSAPLSLSFTPDGKYAYLLLGGTSELGNSGSLRVYQVGDDGKLRLAPSQPLLSHFAYGNPDTVLVSPNGRYVYVSSDQYLQEYNIQSDGSLEEAFALSSPTSYPVSTGNGSLLFALRRMPYAVNTPGFSAMLQAIKVDAIGHMKATTYWIQANGSLQMDEIVDADWQKRGFAGILYPSQDSKHLFVLNPANHAAVYDYTVNAGDGSLALAGRLELPVSQASSGYPVSMTVVSNKPG